MPDERPRDSALDALIEKLSKDDPEVVQAVADVDQRLLDWMLSLTPLERLRASSNFAGALSRYRRVEA